MRMSAASVILGATAILCVAAVAPAAADDTVPLATVARELGYRYAYLALDNAVSLTRPGATIVVRPGDAFFTINERREPVYGEVPFYRDNDVVVSRAFEREIGPAPRHVAVTDERDSRPSMAPREPEHADVGKVRTMSAYFLGSASAIEVVGTATPGAHVSLVLRANLSDQLPVVTLDGTDAVAGSDGTFRARLDNAPDRFSFSRYFIEASGPSDAMPAIVAVRDLGLDRAAHTDADSALKH
jgi:hypothetical protein